METLTSALAALSDGPMEAAGVGERIDRLLAARARLDELVYAEVARLDASGGYVVDGSVTAAGWLRAGHRMARRDASALVHQARELRVLEVTAKALADGAISREHVVQIVKAKTASGLDPAAFGTYEAILVDLAKQASPDEVKAAAAALVEAAAPDRDRQLVDALAGRRFDLYPVGDLVKVDAMIDKVTAEALVSGVEALSRRLPGDERTWHQRRADAFSELVMLSVESGQVPRQGRVKPHVGVMVSLDQLAGVEGSGPLLARFGRVPAATGRRLACDAVLTRFLTDPHGEVLDVGRACRYTTTAQNKALAVMYEACGYPNCATPLTRCDIHHVTWWSHGGPTDLANLVPLCKQHHLFVHEHGYQILAATNDHGTAVTGPKRWTFHTPRGHPIPDHRNTLSHHLDQLTLIPATP